MLSLSLHHVAGHVGNITGEILSTINSLSPFWLTLQHSSPLAGHSTSALADSDGGCFGIKKQAVVVTGVGLDSLSLGGLPQTLLCLSNHTGDTTDVRPVCPMSLDDVSVKESVLLSSSTGNLSRPRVFPREGLMILEFIHLKYQGDRRGRLLGFDLCEAAITGIGTSGHV